MGPVVSQTHKGKVADWIEKGVDEGAELILDGRTAAAAGNGEAASWGRPSSTM